VKINTDGKRSYTEDYLKIHRTTAQLITELNIHLEDSVSTKTVGREPHKSNSHGKAATAKPLITEGKCSEA
jgi:hypothetical protein